MFGSSDGLDDLERAIDTLIATEQQLDLPRLRRCVDRLEAVWLGAVRVEDRDDAWLAHACRLSSGAARRAIATARRLDDLPKTEAAFGSGAITREHVDAIVRACTPERLEAIVAIEADLVEAAGHMGPREFRAAVQYVCDVIDGDGGAASAREQFALRRVHVWRTITGMVAGKFLLDGEAGEVVVTALEAHMHRDRDLTPTQRRADAFTEVFQRSMGEGGDTGRRARPSVNVVVDLDVLCERGHRAVVADVHADLEHIGRVSVATLRRLTCDAHVHRVLTAGSSEVLDVGRRTRTVPTALWHALVVRDRHCRAPGCDRPPGWCEAHHIVHWADGGLTSLDNLILLCWRHHRTAHETRAGPMQAAA